MFMWLTAVCVALITSAVCPAAADQAGPGPDDETRAISKVIEDNIGWFKTKDFGLLFSTYNNGPDLLMYQLDTQSTIKGFDELQKYSVGWKNPDVSYFGHKFSDTQIHVSQSGDVAWFSTMLEDCARIKGREPRCFTSRYTGVLEKRDGRWLIVQQHFSLPADLVAGDWATRTAHPPTEDVSGR